MSIQLPDPTRLSTSALRRAVETDSEGVPRSAAIHALLARRFPFKAAAFETVLDSENCGLGTRLVAISALARLACPKSIFALERAARMPEPRLRRAALLALGRVAGPGSLEVVSCAAAGAGVSEREAASFAALLIACRAGTGPALSEVQCETYTPGTCSSVAISVKGASESEIEDAVWALADESLAVDATTETALSLDCGDVHWIVALDKAAVTAVVAEPAAASSSCVLGIISEEDVEDGVEYDVTAVLLADRSGDRGKVLGYDPTGRLTHVGTLLKSKDAIDLDLASVNRPEVAPVELGLTLAAGPRVRSRYARMAVGLTRKVRLRAS